MAIDAGNTEVSFGVYAEEELIARWRLSTRTGRTADELSVQLMGILGLKGIRAEELKAVILGSVVPGLNAGLLEAVRGLTGLDAMVVGPGVRTGLRVCYDPPREVGADRIANAVAAFRRFGTATVVVDAGTALTYDAISADGDYLGGAISPGIEISLEALVSQTALLPRVEVAAPPAVIGQNTATAIQAGVIVGAAAQVEGMVARMKSELGAGRGEEVRVIATGGQAALLAGLTGVIEVVDPLLTLEGLRLIHLLNV